MKLEHKRLFNRILEKYNKLIFSVETPSFYQISDKFKRDLIVASLYINNARIVDSCRLLNMNRTTFTLYIRNNDVLGEDGLVIYKYINKAGMYKERKTDRARLVAILKEILFEYI